MQYNSRYATINTILILIFYNPNLKKWDLNLDPDLPGKKYLNPDHDPKIWDMIPKDHRSLKIMQFTDITYTRV